MAPTTIPEIPAPLPTLCNIIRPAPGEVLSGVYDFEARLTASPRHRSVRLYIDGQPIGDAPMFNLTRGRYTQLVDTSRYENGKHEFAIAALDERGEVLFTRVRTVEIAGDFKVEGMGTHATSDRGGYELTFKLLGNRCELPKERYQVVSWFSPTERVAAEPERIDYVWTNEDTPTCRLVARLPSGVKVPARHHRVFLGVRDRDGAVHACLTQDCDGV